MKGSRIVFRVDASLAIGTGHVMRCLTLADALREQGAICQFVSRSHEGNLIELQRQRGHEVTELQLRAAAAPVPCTEAEIPLHAAWLGSDWASDADETCAAVQGRVDWLIVDHYALDSRWEGRVRGAARWLLAIDDLADRRHACDLLLDQNLGRTCDDYQRLVPPDCSLLIGPRHALLRPEYAALRAYSLARRREPRLRHLLIAMGGVDKNNATGRILAFLAGAGLPDGCRVTAVLGPHAPWISEVTAQAACTPWPTTVRVGIPDLAQLMADSDLAIGAAGTTAWERCALGLPSLILVLADNQQSGAEALVAAGAALIVSTGADMQEDLRSKLHRLGSASQLAEFTRRCSSIADGGGTERVISAMVHEQF